MTHKAPSSSDAPAGPSRHLQALILAVATAVALGLQAAPALAAPAAFDDFRVTLMPEYDDPGVLSIFESDLDSSVQLPYRFSYAVPAEAKVNMACQLTPNGQHQ